jgi:hypothetical protein
VSWAAAPFLWLFGDPAGWARTTHSWFQVIPLVFAMCSLALPILADAGDAGRAMRDLERFKSGDRNAFDRPPHTAALLFSSLAIVAAVVAVYLTVAHLCLAWNALMARPIAAPTKAVVSGALIVVISLAGIARAVSAIGLLRHR